MNAAVKVLCLTAWRRPINFYNINMSDFLILFYLYGKTKKELKYFISFFEFLLKFVKLPDLFSQSQYVVQKYLHFWSLLERVDIPFSKPKLLDRYRNQIRLKFTALFFIFKQLPELDASISGT